MSFQSEAAHLSQGRAKNRGGRKKFFGLVRRRAEPCVACLKISRSCRSRGGANTYSGKVMGEQSARAIGIYAIVNLAPVEAGVGVGRKGKLHDDR